MWAVLVLRLAGSVLSKLESTHEFYTSCSADEMMMVLSSTNSLIAELLFAHVFMGGRKVSLLQEL